MAFLNPFFLVALGAAAVPVVVHLVRKMKAKPMPFGSLMFLRATPKERVRRRRLRDVLLMAVRMALLALLALVFARPYLPERTLPFFPAEGDRAVVLLLDRSFSMRYGDRFERARAEALRRLDEAGPDDAFAVLAFDDAVQVLTPLGPDRALHRTVLENARPGYRPTDFYAALRRAGDLLAEAPQANRRVVLLSDVQRTGWDGAFDNWTLAPDIAFEVVAVAAEAADNAYVEAVTLTPRRVGDRMALRLDARLGGAPVAGAVLELDGAEVGRQAPAPGTPVTFLVPPLDEGVYRGVLRLPGDGLPVDDRYHFTFSVAPRPSILVVDAAPRGTRRDAFFLEKALAPVPDGPYRVVTGGPGQLTAAALRRHRVVFLANPRTLTAAQTAALRRFAEDGGTVVVSFGDRAGALAAPLQALGLGTPEGRVSARAVQAADAVIGEVDFRHPVFSPFAGLPALFRPVFRTYLRLRPDSAAVVPGRYDTGDPFLVERRLGRGAVLAYTATFNLDWTDFPVQELYVPFVYQLVRYALREATPPPAFRVGDPVPLDGRPGDVWDVRAPDDRVFRVPVGAAGRGFFREAETPGPYVAVRGSRQYPFAVNVDPAESDLTVRDAEEAYAAVVPPATAPTDPQAAAALARADAEQRQGLWRLALMLVLALFAVETYQAHRRRVKSPEPASSGSGRVHRHPVPQPPAS